MGAYVHETNGAFPDSLLLWINIQRQITSGMVVHTRGTAVSDKVGESLSSDVHRVAISLFSLSYI